MLSMTKIRIKQTKHRNFFKKTLTPQTLNINLFGKLHYQLTLKLTTNKRAPDTVILVSEEEVRSILSYSQQCGLDLRVKSNGRPRAAVKHKPKKFM